jgi:protein phosphatase
LAGFKVCGLTDKGTVRGNNEDAIGYLEDACLYVLSDGMGGYKAGEVASKIVTDNALSHFKTLGTKDNFDIKAYFDYTVKTSAEEIKSYASKDASLKGMGATVCILYLSGGRYYVAWVGDSRAYLIRGEAINPISEDHSLVYQMHKKGEISYDDISFHPASNIITKAIGNDLGIKPDIKEGDISKGDKFLLCSDGLTGELKDGEILEIIQKNTIEKACKELIFQANENGGKDNISVIIIDSSL